MAAVDLTPFGFTPTESKVYQVLLTGGPGTGYAIAQTAGLARANTYSALEGLVSKGAARVEGGRPKRYRPEVPEALVARLSNYQAYSLDQLHEALAAVSVPLTPTLVEIVTPRAALQLLSREIARATKSVILLAPADAFPVLVPSLRRAVSVGLAVELYALVAVDLQFASVAQLPPLPSWPGEPLVAVVDGRGAVIASRVGQSVTGHWGAVPAFVAAARCTLERWRMAG